MKRELRTYRKNNPMTSWYHRAILSELRGRLRWNLASTVPTLETVWTPGSSSFKCGP